MKQSKKIKVMGAAILIASAPALATGISINKTENEKMKNNLFSTYETDVKESVFLYQAQPKTTLDNMDTIKKQAIKVREKEILNCEALIKKLEESAKPVSKNKEVIESMKKISQYLKTIKQDLVIFRLQLSNTQDPKLLDKEIQFSNIEREYRRKKFGELFDQAEKSIDTAKKVLYKKISGDMIKEIDSISKEWNKGVSKLKENASKAKLDFINNTIKASDGNKDIEQLKKIKDELKLGNNLNDLPKKEIIIKKLKDEIKKSLNKVSEFIKNNFKEDALDSLKQKYLKDIEDVVNKFKKTIKDLEDKIADNQLLSNNKEITNLMINIKKDFIDLQTRHPFWTQVITASDTKVKLEKSNKWAWAELKNREVRLDYDITKIQKLIDEALLIIG